jgi:hypothetical protein
MIRIDEIYNNTFWPWLLKNKPGCRLFFCDPPGRSDPESLYNYGIDDVENDFIFMHDQEPIHLDLHQFLFDTVYDRNQDIRNQKNIYGKRSRREQNSFGRVVVSERGKFVQELTNIYGWKSYYYFYHGWACKDWFRGYDKTFLIPRANDRTPTKTFISPNRIVGGKRDHRVLFLYHVLKNQLDSNYISAPRICPYEKMDVVDIAKKYNSIYPDIEQVFLSANLPKFFQGEETQLMTSCWLSNFQEAQDSLVYVPTETVYFGERLHLTEKSFKAIALEMPFVLVAPCGSLDYLREYGFQTFHSIFDESYDEESNDVLRLEKVSKLLYDLNQLTVKERQQIHRACVPIVEHNYNHFYGTGFEQVLWHELLSMLNEIRCG